MDRTFKLIASGPIDAEPNGDLPAWFNIHASNAIPIRNRGGGFDAGLGSIKHQWPKIMSNIVHILEINNGWNVELQGHLSGFESVVSNVDDDLLFGLSKGLGEHAEHQ